MLSREFEERMIMVKMKNKDVIFGKMEEDNYDARRVF